MDNMWHVLFNAVPAREQFLRRGLDVATTDFLPRYTTYWPWSNHVEQSPHLKPVLDWPGWEILVRSILSNNDRSPFWEETAARTQHLIVPRHAHCYSTLYGGRLPWWPVAQNRSQLIAARQLHSNWSPTAAGLGLALPPEATPQSRTPGDPNPSLRPRPNPGRQTISTPTPTPTPTPIPIPIPIPIPTPTPIPTPIPIPGTSDRHAGM